jgi:hypothetical protein
MPSIADLLAHVGDVSVPVELPVGASLGDQELLDGQRMVAEVQRRLAAIGSALAGEIAYRSRRELGHEGLAQSWGQRTAEGLISQLTGGSTRDARTLVKAGELLPAARPDAVPVARWLVVIGAAVGRAVISVEAAALIKSRLGDAFRGQQPDAAALEVLADAATRLVAEARSLTIEQLGVRASRMRDELDLAGVPAREDALREKRFLRVTRQLDGMTRISGLLDPESAAIVVPILDAATSPRRGGPRFVHPDAVQRAEEIVRGQRTTDQLGLDVFVELVRAGARVDSGRLLGDRKPAVRILVTKRDLDAREGAAHFEGQTEPASISTAERLICATGAVPILFDDDGKALNLGREQRLFSERQRIALAARDGGCLMCDRPPSWCEAHHIDHWDEHQGRTDVDDGVLLCRFCHLQVHNRGWRLTREGAHYFLERPDQHGTIRRTPLPGRSPTHDRLLSA